MGRKPNTETQTGVRRRPGITPEARENQMIALAIDLAEKQLMEGTASSQVITHFLKLGSTREKLEQQHLASQTELAMAKKDAVQSTKRFEELCENAMRAMKRYQGNG